MLNIVKIGGNIIDSAEQLDAFLANFAGISESKILVHGGGKIATAKAQKLGIEAKMVDGRRITDTDMLEVVTMVYGGLVNKSIVAQLQKLGSNAIGLTGADGNAIAAHKRPVKEIDYGWVGDIDHVNKSFINSLLALGISPVFAPLTHDGQGHMLNTNADTQAAAIATAMAENQQTRLIYCFEKRGVLADATNDDSVINQIDTAAYQNLKESGAVFAGMIPKLDNAFEAIKAGVSSVVICHASELNAAIAGKAGTTIID